MNRQEREILSQKHIRRMNRFEREFTPGVFKALKKYISSFTGDIKNHGLDKAKSNLEQSIGFDGLNKPILNIYKIVGSYFADKTLYELRVEENKGFGINIDWVNEILNYFNSLLLSKAVIPITETTKIMIRYVLIKAESEGWGVDKIVRELNSDELVLWRARMIVRTETNKAMFYGQKLGESKSEYESVKGWVSAKDHRTRHSHREMDGKVINTNDKFMVPVYRSIGGVQIRAGFDMMELPGDPSASAGNVINCRCTSYRRLKRENGQLVLKKKI